MSLLSSDDYAAIQQAQLLTMHDLCNVYRITYVSGSTGNNVQVRSAVYTNLPCGIDFTNGQIVENGLLMGVEYKLMLRVENDVTILTGDEIDVVEKGQFVISGTFTPDDYPTVNSSVQKIRLRRVSA